MTGTEFVEARAKINLYLHVTGRRDDGYHELDSLLVRTTVADRLKFSLHHRDVLEFRSSIGELSPGFGEPDNLVMRAVRILRDASGRTDHIRVELDKSIPVAAGLGGGSADAAATLQAVARMFDWHGSLTELAGSLGADVPACLYAHPVTVSGIGEKIRRTPSLPDCSVVLINPRRPLLTAAVFKRYGRPIPGPRPPHGGLLQSGPARECAESPPERSRSNRYPARTLHRPDHPDLVDIRRRAACPDEWQRAYMLRSC